VVIQGVLKRDVFKQPVLQAECSAGEMKTLTLPQIQHEIKLW
jgi:hypothetical protein